MKKTDNRSSEKRIGEWLGLLPARIRRCFRKDHEVSPRLVWRAMDFAISRISGDNGNDSPLVPHEFVDWPGLPAGMDPNDLVEKLIKLGYLELRKSDSQLFLTTAGFCYFENRRKEILGFLGRSLLTPIVVAAITALVTHWIAGLFG